VLEQKVNKSFELILHKKRENLFERNLLVCKVNGSHFQVVAYKEFATFPSE
jgi:hypothetical protein